MPISNLVKQALVLTTIAIILAIVANFLHHRPLPFFGDWAHHLEAQAFKARIPIVDIAAARTIAATSSHLILDARSLTNYLAGHITSAISFPYEERLTSFIQNGSLLASNKRPLLVYCANQHCDDALNLAIFLREQGITNISIFLGGWETWQKNISP